LLAAAATLVDIDWSPLGIAYLLLAIVGGALVELSVPLAASALGIRLTSVRSIRVVLDQVFNTFGGYPQTIYPVGARFALTFVLPAAFVAYAAPAAGVLLLVAAYRLWSAQIRHYQSTGH
jgi:ABC-2 type transport system permease protein